MCLCVQEGGREGGRKNAKEREIARETTDSETAHIDVNGARVCCDTDACNKEQLQALTGFFLSINLRVPSVFSMSQTLDNPRISPKFSRCSLTHSYTLLHTLAHSCTLLNSLAHSCTQPPRGWVMHRVQGGSWVHVGATGSHHVGDASRAARMIYGQGLGAKMKTAPQTRA